MNVGEFQAQLRSKAKGERDADDIKVCKGKRDVDNVWAGKDKRDPDNVRAGKNSFLFFCGERERKERQRKWRNAGGHEKIDRKTDRHRKTKEDFTREKKDGGEVSKEKKRKKKGWKIGEWTKSPI